jgi:hypothetical protein
LIAKTNFPYLMTEKENKKIVGSGDLRQMSEYPIPHGGHCIPAS